MLDLHVPVVAAFQGKGGGPLWASGALSPEGALLAALARLAPNLLTYVMSFLTLGIFWVGQQTQLNHFERSDRTLTWIHLAFLLAVSLLPFSTALLAAYILSRVALVVYWLNLLLLGLGLFASIRYAKRAGLLKEEVTADTRAAHERRIVIWQAIYACAVALCVINTYVSLAFLVLAQLNSVVAPRLGPF